jgi:hypothetical protein
MKTVDKKTQALYEVTNVLSKENMSAIRGGGGGGTPTLPPPPNGGR